MKIFRNLPERIARQCTVYFPCRADDSLHTPSEVAYASLPSSMHESLDHPVRRTAQHAIVALGIFITVVTVSNGPLKATILDWQNEGSFSMAIEHGQVASIAITRGERNGTAIIEFRNDGEHTVLLSLPDNWKRREVRGARLEDFGPTQTGLGYIRWTLPAKATISMAASVAPRHLTLHHPTASPLKVELQRIDLERDSVDRNVLLIQSSKARLW